MAIGYPKRSCAIELFDTDVSSSNPFPVKNGLGDLVLDAWGTPKVTQPFTLFHSVWTFDVSPKLWIKSENGSEVNSSTRIVSEYSMLKVSSGSSLNSYSNAYSKRHPRYQPNRGHLFSTAVYLPNKTAAGQRDFGLFSEENGVFFRLKSDGKMYAVLRNNSIDVKEELITPSFNVDYEKGNIYDIQFQWRGVGNYKFFIGDPDTGASKLVHMFDILGTSTSLSINNPALPVCYQSTNKGSEVVIYSGCCDVTSEGGSDEKQYYTSSILLGKTINTNTPILAIRQPDTINGKINTRDILLSRVTINASKKSSVGMFVTRDATAISGGSWSAIQNSYVEENSTISSVDFTKMSQVTVFSCEAGVSKETTNPNKDIIQFWLVRGDCLVLVGNGAGALVDAVIEFGEEI